MTKPLETQRARTVYKHAKSSVDNFFKTFDEVRTVRRGKKGGPPTDEEQDIVRAALVFAAAGLDSCLKELIKGSLRRLAELDNTVRSEFEAFVQRQLRGDGEDPETVSGNKFLATVLAAPNPQERLLYIYVLDLTGTSLQSVEQLLRAASALGVDKKPIIDQKKNISAIFQDRNLIIHELDIQFSEGRLRQRNPRRRDDLRTQCNVLLKLAESILVSVETKLGGGARHQVAQSI